MDTKLKNYKTGIFIKVTAFFLMLAFVFGSVFMLSKTMVYCTGYNYYPYLVLEDDIKGADKETAFWKSSLSQKPLKSDAINLYLYAKYFYDENAVNDGTAFKKLENDLRAPLESRIAKEISDEWNNTRSRAREELFSTIWETNKNSRQQRNLELFKEKFPNLDITTIEYREDLTREMLDWYVLNCTNWGPDEKSIRKEFTSETEKSVSTAKKNFNSVYRKVSQRVNEIKTNCSGSLNYVIVLPDGHRLTNFADGETISYDELYDRVTNAKMGYSFTEKYGSSCNTQTIGGYDVPLINYISLDNTDNSAVSNLDDLGFNENYFNQSGNSNSYNMFRKNNIDFYIFSSEIQLTEEHLENDIYAVNYTQFCNLTDNIIPALFMAAVAFVILILLVVFSGSKEENGTYRKAKIDKIYNDWHFIISAGIVALSGICAFAFLFDELEYWVDETSFVFLVAPFLSAVCCAFFTEWLMSLSRQIKSRTLFKHTFVYAVAAFFKRKIRSASAKTKNKIKNNKILRHHVTQLRRDIWLFVALFTVGNIAIVSIAGFFFAAYEEFLAFLFIIALVIYNIAAAVFIWRSIIALDKIMQAVSSAEQGNLNVTLDIGSMPRWIRKFAQDVQDMQNGMRAAVQEAIKGERMKTELITNVSHDLKTPLTSIVTYVDLLKKRPIDDKDALEYITVLDEKSARLKHLIEDLVEASKTTTGNVELHPVKINLYELALQSVGENEDALNAHGLEVRLSTQPEKPIVVYADNQKTWRIIENLISNVRKYAMSGTRVYISIEEKGGFGVFSVKNITREPIDVPASELTARFVRGDSSRSTEGSGLGLSIASNLCGLQGGKLDLTIDGDLFKATVYLPIAK